MMYCPSSCGFEGYQKSRLLKFSLDDMHFSNDFRRSLGFTDIPFFSPISGSYPYWPKEAPRDEEDEQPLILLVLVSAGCILFATFC